MNEYERLINYLNSVINDVANRRKIIEEKNKRNLIVKSSLSNIIDLINNHKLNEIKIDEIDNLLNELVSEEEIDNIKNKIVELSNMQSFLFDERISNPIKEIMLMDLENIIFKFNSIIGSIMEISIPLDDVKLEEECRKYLEIVDKNGYTRILSDEERLNYYKFLQDNNIEDALLLIAKYIMFANKNVVRIEDVTAVSENSVDDPIREFREKRDVVLSKEEKERRQQEFKLVYDKILVLLEIFDKERNQELYEKYSNYFGKMDIYEIYSNRSDFLTATGVNWQIAIPCIKERIIPNINNSNRALVFKLFNEIVALNNDVLIKYEEDKRKNELLLEKERLDEKIYDEKIASFNSKYLPFKDVYDKLSENVKDIVKKVENSTTIENRLSLIELINDPSNALFEFYHITRDELMIYLLYSKIKKNIDLIDKELNNKDIRIADEEFSFLYEVLDEVNGYISEISSYDLLDNKIYDIEVDNPTIDDKKQYEVGNNIIIFYRHDEYSPFMIEDDINSINDGNAIKEVDIKTREILKRLNDIPFIDLNKGYSKFLQLIREGQDQNSDIHTFKSETVGKEYSFYRFSLREDVRISCLKVELSQEMQRKLNISSKYVLIVMGLQYIVNHKNAKSDSYTKFISELENEHYNVDELIGLLEGKKHDDELLFKLLNDSSLLYDRFREKTKELGD